MSRLRAEPSGHVISLGSQIARGGEGSVHEVERMPRVAAKVYHTSTALTTQKILKLQAMIGAADENLLRFTAWPRELLLDESGKVRGFLMSQVDARSDLFGLYNPKSRAGKYPEHDFRFLCSVTTNVARAFAAIHAAGHVIGDINHGHMLVRPDGRVVLIDVDSLQVAIGGTTYTCDVGAPNFQPPELLQQSGTFTGLHRTENHDRFGLAVVLFHMLFMGRHPFAVRWTGPGDPPNVAEAIKNNYFAFSAGPSNAHVQQPVGTLDLSAFGDGIAGLFESAFKPQSRNKRPSASQWISELKSLEGSLVRCGVSNKHYYPNTSVSRCTWCGLEAKASGTYFGSREGSSRGAGSVAQGRRQSTRQTARPAAAASRSPLGTARPSATAAKSSGGGFAFLGLVALGLLVVVIMVNQGTSGDPDPEIVDPGGGLSEVGTPGTNSGWFAGEQRGVGGTYAGIESNDNEYALVIYRSEQGSSPYLFRIDEEGETGPVPTGSITGVFYGGALPRINTFYLPAPERAPGATLLDLSSTSMGLLGFIQNLSRGSVLRLTISGRVHGFSLLGSSPALREAGLITGTAVSPPQTQRTPAAPPPPRRKQVSITYTGDPGWAELFIDGVSQGNTPWISTGAGGLVYGDRRVRLVWPSNQGQRSGETIVDTIIRLNSQEPLDLEFFGRSEPR